MFVIFLLPKLRTLDFQKVTQKERELAEEMFSKPENYEALCQRQKQIDSTNKTIDAKPEAEIKDANTQMQERTVELMK